MGMKLLCTSRNTGEGKRRHDFAEWHVACVAEWDNYAKCNMHVECLEK